MSGGVVYAANTIGSSDIIDESILSQDIKNGQVKTAHIGNNQVRTVDVVDDTFSGGGLGSSDIAANTLTGADVADTGSLGTAEIDESTLNGLGANDGFDAFCDVSSLTFVDCDGATTITLGRAMNVLVIATTHFDSFGAAPAAGNCRLERDDAAVSINHPIGELDAGDDTSSVVHQGGMNLVDVQSLAAGTYTFEVSCNETNSDIEFRNVRLAAVELSQE